MEKTIAEQLTEHDKIIADKLASIRRELQATCESISELETILNEGYGKTHIKEEKNNDHQ